MSTNNDAMSPWGQVPGAGPATEVKPDFPGAGFGSWPAGAATTDTFHPPAVPPMPAVPPPMPARMAAPQAPDNGNGWLTLPHGGQVRTGMGANGPAGIFDGSGRQVASPGYADLPENAPQVVTAKHVIGADGTTTTTLTGPVHPTRLPDIFTAKPGAVPEKMAQGTSNIEHPTSNIEGAAADFGGEMGQPAALPSEMPQLPAMMQPAQRGALPAVGPTWDDFNRRAAADSPNSALGKHWGPVFAHRDAVAAAAAQQQQQQQAMQAAQQEMGRGFADMMAGKQPMPGASEHYIKGYGQGWGRAIQQTNAGTRTNAETRQEAAAPAKNQGQVIRNGINQQRLTTAQEGQQFAQDNPNGFQEGQTQDGRTFRREWNGRQFKTTFDAIPANGELKRTDHAANGDEVRFYDAGGGKLSKVVFHAEKPVYDTVTQSTPDQTMRVTSKVPAGTAQMPAKPGAAGDGTGVNAKAQSEAEGAKPAEEMRMVNGQAAYFDAKTHQFLRWQQ